MRLNLLFFFLLSGCAVPHYKSITEIHANIKPYDIRAVEWFFSNQISYFRDTDTEKSSDKTIAHGFGNCLNYAMLARDITGTWPNCEARIIPKGECHVVTWLKCDNGIYGYWENGGFNRQKHDSKIFNAHR